jgi:retron-type reverse transcriptase
MVLLHIVNTSLCSGTYYSAWKVNKVVPIPKKGDLSEISNWRPITIANCLASTTEKIASAQFLKFCEKYEQLFIRQNGFRLKMSCSTAISQICNFLRSNQIKGETLGAILLVDAKNAFGSVCHLQLLDKLFSLCSDKAFAWFRSFLAGREFYVEINGQQSKTIPLPDHGVVQGSGPGPSPSTSRTTMYSQALRVRVIWSASLTI